MYKHIVAERLVEDIEWLYDNKMLGPYETFCFLAMLDRQSAADVAPVRHAHWIDTGDGYIKCSSCGYSTPHIDFEDTTLTLPDIGEVMAYGAPPYCKHCGARMDEEVSE